MPSRLKAILSMGASIDNAVVLFSLPREFFHQSQLPPDAIGRICVETDRYSGAVFHRRIQRQITLPWSGDR